MLADVRNPEPLLAAAVLLLAAVLAWAVPARRLRWALSSLGWWERVLARLARRRWVAVAIAVAVPMIVRAALLPWFPIPEPRVQDEFSFLLGADTLAHGRLANPMHPLWVHFETFHVLSRPVYGSAFPLGPAAPLAIGMALFGHPWFGVWLSGGLMCGAIYWMLEGWVSESRMGRRWALLGALLAAVQFGVASYWMNSYWGGFVAAAGGALVLGVLPRAMRAPNWGLALIYAAGLAILAHSRSFEGGVFGLAVSAVLLVSIWRRADRAAWGFVVPLGMALVVLAAGTLYYFWRLTGSPWTPPYVLYRNTMTVVPHFVVFQKPGAAPLYNNRALWDFYANWEMLAYREAVQFPRDVWVKSQAYWRFYLGPLLTVALVGLVWMRRHTVWPLLAIGGFFFIAGLAFQVWHNLHYAAPATGLVMLLVTLGLRGLRLWRPLGRPFGLILARLLPAACVAMLAIRVAAGPEPAGAAEQGWRWPRGGCTARARIVERLRTMGGKHLVMVRYSMDHHDSGAEWVFNGADIDGEQVVWARELDAADNARLRQYFSDRKVWLIEPDEAPDCSAGGAGPELMEYEHAPAGLMPLVHLGAPEIASIRDPERVRVDVQTGGTARGGALRCAEWNELFSAATGVQGPKPVRDCYGGDPEARVPFEKWWAWLQTEPRAGEGR